MEIGKPETGPPNKALIFSTSIVHFGRDCQIQDILLNFIKLIEFSKGFLTLIMAPSIPFQNFMNTYQMVSSNPVESRKFDIQSIIIKLFFIKKKRRRRRKKSSSYSSSYT